MGTDHDKKHSGEAKENKDAVQLHRQIGLLPAVCFIVGTVVGSGIFIAPKGVLMNSGTVGLSLVVWGLCGVLSLLANGHHPVAEYLILACLLGALCYAELGTTFSKSGGHYTYLLETLGPLPAFLRIWSEFFFIRPAVASYVALAFGRYVVDPFFTPCAAPTALIKVVGILGVTFVVAVNCWSVSVASQTQVTLTFIKMFALILIIIPGIIALAKGKTEHFQNSFEAESLTLDRLPLAFYNGLYAYGGWFYLNYITEEVINPNRNIPLAIICSMVTVTVFYVLVNVAYYTVLSPAELLQSDAVAVTFASRALQGLSSVIPILVSISCLGALNGGFFGVPRMFFVGARDGHWPPIFSMIHIRRHTPVPAVLFLYPLVVLMMIHGEIYRLINFASFPRWFFLASATLGMLIHRYRFPLKPRPFKVPVVIVVIFTAVSFFIVGFSLYSDPWNTGCSCGLTLSGVPVYYVTVQRSWVPVRLRRFFNLCSKQMQILLEVVQQDVQTY